MKIELEVLISWHAKDDCKSNKKQHNKLTISPYPMHTANAGPPCPMTVVTAPQNQPSQESTELLFGVAIAILSL